MGICHTKVSGIIDHDYSNGRVLPSEQSEELAAVSIDMHSKLGKSSTVKPTPARTCPASVFTPSLPGALEASFLRPRLTATQSHDRHLFPEHDHNRPGASQDHIVSFPASKPKDHSCLESLPSSSIPLEPRLAACRGAGTSGNMDVVSGDGKGQCTSRVVSQVPSRWRKGENIGSGSFGRVYLGLNCITGELIAVKEVMFRGEGKQDESVEQLEQEVAVLSKLDHPNIVRYLGTTREAAALYIFLEYVSGGSLASLVSRFGPLDEGLIQLFTRQLLSGLAYLHDQRTVHRDIKGANLLVETCGSVKLADFGMAKQMVEQSSFTKSFKGSAYWMAPEVIRQQGHGLPADIWSVGCTIIEMATGRPPWSQCTNQVQAIFKIASSQEIPNIPPHLSAQACEFLLLCLQRDPASRPSARELLHHPFLRAKGLQQQVAAYSPNTGSLCLQDYTITPEYNSHQVPTIRDNAYQEDTCTGTGRHSNGYATTTSTGGLSCNALVSDNGPDRGVPVQLFIVQPRSSAGPDGPGGEQAVMGNSLAAMVLGTSGNHTSLRRADEPKRHAEGTTEPEDVLQYTPHPHLFRVQGKVSLSPLRQLQGQNPLPTLRVDTYLTAGQQGQEGYQHGAP